VSCAFDVIPISKESRVICMYFILIFQLLILSANLV
jgi:hypothetical protein